MNSGGCMGIYRDIYMNNNILENSMLCHSWWEQEVKLDIVDDASSIRDMEEGNEFG